MMSLTLFAQGFRGFPAQGDIPPEAAGVVIAAMLGVALIGLAIGLLISAAICFLLYRCYQRIPVEHQQMESWQVWLLMIPCFNIVWNFFVYPKLAKSYQSYFASQGRTDLGDCGEQLGLWFAICCAASIVPYLGAITGIAGLVLLIMFLVKAWDLRQQIPEGDMMQPPMQQPM